MYPNANGCRERVKGLRECIAEEFKINHNCCDQSSIIPIITTFAISIIVEAKST